MPDVSYSCINTYPARSDFQERKLILEREWELFWPQNCKKDCPVYDNCSTLYLSWVITDLLIYILARLSLINLITLIT